MKVVKTCFLKLVSMLMINNVKLKKEIVELKAENEKLRMNVRTLKRRVYRLLYGGRV